MKTSSLYVFLQEDCWSPSQVGGQDAPRKSAPYPHQAALWPFPLPWHRSEGNSELCGRVWASKPDSDETWGSLDTLSNPGACSHMDRIFCPRRCEFLLMLCIWILSSWVDLSLSLSFFPFSSCALVSFLPSLFLFLFFSFMPLSFPWWFSTGPIPFLRSLAPAAAASSSDFRMGPSLWSLSAAHAQHHPPSTRRSVKLQGSAAHACLFCQQKPSARLWTDGIGLKLSLRGRWNWIWCAFSSVVLAVAKGEWKRLREQMITSVLTHVFPVSHSCHWFPAALQYLPC